MAKAGINRIPNLLTQVSYNKRHARQTTHSENEYKFTATINEQRIIEMMPLVSTSANHLHYYIKPSGVKPVPPKQVPKSRAP